MGSVAGSGIARRRRETTGPQPSTVRGQRTREVLLTAARVVFERDGYLATRVADIATEAGLAHGSFYTYFGSKVEVFRALVTQMLELFYAPSGEESDGAAADPLRRIEAGNRRYIEMYRRNLRMWELFEQVATFDAEVRAFRLEVRRRSAERVSRSIRRLQAEGLADRELDPDCAANALTAMGSDFVYYWLVMGRPADDEVAIATLTRLWAQAIGLRTSP